MSDMWDIPTVDPSNFKFFKLTAGYSMDSNAPCSSKTSKIDVMSRCNWFCYILLLGWLYWLLMVSRSPLSSHAQLGGFPRSAGSAGSRASSRCLRTPFSLEALGAFSVLTRGVSWKLPRGLSMARWWHTCKAARRLEICYGSIFPHTNQGSRASSILWLSMALLAGLHELLSKLWFFACYQTCGFFCLWCPVSPFLCRWPQAVCWRSREGNYPRRSSGQRHHCPEIKLHLVDQISKQPWRYVRMNLVHMYI